MVDRDDDARLGIRTSALTLGPLDVAAVMASYARDAGDSALRSVCSLRISLAVFRRPGRRRRAGGLPLAADPRPHARGLLQGVPHNNWIGAAIFAGIVLRPTR